MAKTCLLYTSIDFKRRKDGIAATVLSIEYDPNRTANIALICYADGEKAYILEMCIRDRCRGRNHFICKW